MGTELSCPACHAEFHSHRGTDEEEETVPPVGGIGICFECGFLGVMGESGWAAPDEPTREKLLEDNDIAAAMTLGMSMAEQKRCDIEHLAKQATTWRMAVSMGKLAGMSAEEQSECFARWLIEEHGYHRHTH